MLKGKKMPLWLILVLGLCLALACVGATWLMTASYADPELYAQVTDPVKAYVEEQVHAFDEKVKDVNASISASIDESIDGMKDYVQDKKESLAESFAKKEEDALPAEADLQALSDSVLDSPQGIADNLITDFALNRKGQEVIVGGTYEMIYYNQMDPWWGNYGTDSIYGYGCGPTATAMVVSTLTHLDIDPQEMSDIFYENGYWCASSGTYHTFGNGVAELFNLDVLSLVPEEITGDDLINYLMSGKIAIALMTTGHFTNYGHFIVLRGVTLSGEIMVADPASRDRSLTLWDPELILEELSTSRHHGSPLWLYSSQGTNPLIPDELLDLESPLM